MISVKSARYVKDHLVDILFSDGASGIIDLRETVNRYDAASPLRDPAKFAAFRLDEWPTLTWPCGFDLSPEYLYELLTGSAPAWSEQESVPAPMVAEDGGRWPQ
jgi:hypothetical protein